MKRSGLALLEDDPGAGGDQGGRRKGRAAGDVFAQVQVSAPTRPRSTNRSLLIHFSTHERRKEVVKLRQTQVESLAGTKRILERKLKKVMMEVMEFREEGGGGGNYDGGGGGLQSNSTNPNRDKDLMVRNGQNAGLERGVTWSSDKSKYVPAIPAIGGMGGGPSRLMKEGGVVVTKSGGFTTNMPAGSRGRGDAGSASAKKMIYGGLTGGYNSGEELGGGGGRRARGGRRAKLYRTCTSKATSTNLLEEAQAQEEYLTWAKPETRLAAETKI